MEGCTEDNRAYGNCRAIANGTHTHTHTHTHLKGHNPTSFLTCWGFTINDPQASTICIVTPNCCTHTSCSWTLDAQLLAFATRRFPTAAQSSVAPADCQPQPQTLLAAAAFAAQCSVLAVALGLMASAPWLARCCCLPWMLACYPLALAPMPAQAAALSSPSALHSPCAAVYSPFGACRLPVAIALQFP